MRKWIDLFEGIAYREQLESGYDTFYGIASDHAQNSWTDPYAEMPDLSRETYSEMAKEFLEDMVGRPLYRGMRVRQIDLENAQRLGVFYSELKEHSDGFAHAASRYDDRFDHIENGKDQIGIVIEIMPITDPDSFDLPVTLAMNTYGGEGEVRLLEGEPVTIKQITDTMGRQIWPHLWGETYRA
jgi:hypothetical protein